MRIGNPHSHVLLGSPALPLVPDPQSMLVIWEAIPLAETVFQESRSFRLDISSFLFYCVQVSSFTVWGGFVWGQGLGSPLTIYQDCSLHPHRTRRAL